MKEMLKARKAELEARGKKGFTLMEMLIVIAIIAVLVAIAIPVFSTQLHNARVQSDAANIRSGYAVASATVLTASPAPADGTIYVLNSDGTAPVGATGTGSFACTETAVAGDKVDVAGQLSTWTTGDNIDYVYHASPAAGDPTIEIKTA